jgi:hypothetical protein
MITCAGQFTGCPRRLQAKVADLTFPVRPAAIGATLSDHLTTIDSLYAFKIWVTCKLFPSHRDVPPLRKTLAESSGSFRISLAYVCLGPGLILALFYLTLYIQRLVSISPPCSSRCSPPNRPRLLRRFITFPPKKRFCRPSFL